MRSRIGDEQRIAHIEEAIQEIEEYIKDIDINKFKSNSMIRFASIKQIEIIGEAARHITDQTRKDFLTSNGRRLQAFGIFSPRTFWNRCRPDLADCNGGYPRFEEKTKTK